MTIDTIRGLVESFGEYRQRSGVYLANPDDGIADAEMALLVDDASQGSLFTRTLRALVLDASHILSDQDNLAIAADLRRWFGDDTGGPSLWVKVAIERYPLRLFVATELVLPQSGLAPHEADFWFTEKQGVDACHASVRREADHAGETWHSPDPRAWKEPAWRRFIGKRICWLAPSGVLGILKEIKSSGPGSVLERLLPGFSAVIPLTPTEMFALWLRLKWVEHLACRVRGLDWPYVMPDKSLLAPNGGLRIALALTLRDNTVTHRPATMPPLRDIRQGTPRTACELEADVSVAQVPGLHPMKLGGLFKTNAVVDFAWQRGEACRALAVMNMHQEFVEPDNADMAYKDRWKRRHLSEMAEPACAATTLNAFFSGALSGGLPSHNGVAGLAAEARSVADAWTWLAVAEHALLRVGLCDERIQRTFASGEAATGALQRRVCAVYWAEERNFGQAPFPDHKLYGMICFKNRHCGFYVHGDGRDAERGFLPQLYEGEPWPATIEMLIMHQTILDKWKDVTGRHLARALSDLKDEFPWLTVTSGRGKPEEVPVGSRFLPFSGLQACLVGAYFDKMLLLRQLTSCGGQV
jgi:hypothetical protein